MKKTSWTIEEALCASYEEFAKRFGGAQWLHAAFEALTLQRAQTLRDHAEIGDSLEQWMQYPLSNSWTHNHTWIANALADPTNEHYFIHAGVRWWQARDDLLSKPVGTLVPCVFLVGMPDHVNHQLLAQMLYRGAAPDTVAPQAENVLQQKR